MKTIALIASLILPSQLVFAHGVHPLITNYSKTTIEAYDHALHMAGYVEADFDDLVGLSSIQDTARKVRIVRYRFAGTQCAKDLEVYFKLDGSAYLSYKVVGCVP